MTETSMHDETLGSLHWDESLDRWSAEVDIGLGRLVELHIAGADEGPSAALLQRAKCLVELFCQREREIRTIAAGEMLQRYNDAWNDGLLMSLESFVDSLELDSIVVNRRTAEVSYLPLDEDMFGGHFIVCMLHDDDSVSDVHLVG